MSCVHTRVDIYLVCTQCVFKFHNYRNVSLFDYLEDKAIFNYRLSRARRVIENTFGILAARWRIFRRPIIADPNNVISYTKAAIVLHNYLRTNEPSMYSPAGFVDGEDGSGNIVLGSWREDDQPSGFAAITHTGSNM